MIHFKILEKIKKKLDLWNHKKKETISKKKVAYFKERDIFWMRMGENIGTEQSGKGELFMRPVIIIKKFNKHCFWAVPLTTNLKDGKYYSKVLINNQEQRAIISQMRLFDVYRLERKIGFISKKDFNDIKKAIQELLMNDL